MIWITNTYVRTYKIGWWIDDMNQQYDCQSNGQYELIWWNDLNVCMYVQNCWWIDDMNQIYDW